QGHGGGRVRSLPSPVAHPLPRARRQAPPLGVGAGARLLPAHALPGVRPPQLVPRPLAQSVLLSMDIDAGLDLVRSLVVRDGFVVVTTTRADGSMQASVVNAGVL